jgi:hypothetical protein
LFHSIYVYFSWAITVPSGTKHRAMIDIAMENLSKTLTNDDKSINYNFMAISIIDFNYDYNINSLFIVDLPMKQM